MDIQTIILVGHLLSDAETFTDKSGRDYIRFRLSCRKLDYKGETKFTVYRVCCYQTGFENLKQGDQVYVSGDIDIRVNIDDDKKVWLNIEVFARQITKGSSELTRIKKTNKK